MNEESELAEEFDFEHHKIRAIEEYQKARPLYEEYADVIKKILFEIFKAQNIKIHSIEARAKAVDDFGNKALTPSPDNPSKPYYPNPLSDIKDMAGVRIIVFFPKTLDLVDNIIKAQLEVIEKYNKALTLMKEEKFGYASIHYLVKLKDNRINLLEYSRFRDLVAEIQVRTILQHAWAEIEHDIQYKSVEITPDTIRRRFMSLAGMLEIADREFQAIQDADDRLRIEARKSVREGKLERVEITSDALKTYLDKKLGADGRMKDFSYQWTARLLRNLGFTDFKQIDQCISGFDDDKLSRIAQGARMGQITRFENLLLAGMGEDFINYHIWKEHGWFISYRKHELAKFKEAGISVGSYIPSMRRIT